MDEPTAGVDNASQEALAATLGVLADRGTTLLVVTHEAGALRSVVRRAVVVRDGTIDYDGPVLPWMVERTHDHAHHANEADAAAPTTSTSVTGLDQPRLGR
jgi:zinc transport system ATP-binding protein